MQQPIKYFHNRLNSTNLLAAEQVQNRREKTPFWIRTDEQFAGRGQGTRTWDSMPGENITGTLVIYPENFDAARQFALSQVFALAATSFLGLYLDEVRIKWPNDLYYRNKKIGGILIETAIMGNRIDHAILGIGINVNQLVFPSGLPNPVSIGAITGLHYDLPAIEDLFLESFVTHYSMLESGLFERIGAEYINKLYRFGESVSFRIGSRVVAARISGITEFGQLILDHGDGTSAVYNYQELEYIIGDTD